MIFGNKSKEFVPIPDDIFGKTPDMGLSKQELKVWMAIMKKTFGYEDGRVGDESIRKIKQPLSPKYVEKMTGIPRRTVIRTYKRLEEQKIVRITKEYYPDGLGREQLTTTVEVNLDTSQWIPKEQIVKRGAKSINMGYTHRLNETLLCGYLIFNN